MVLEALACGTPVVATPVGVVNTILKEGVNGVIVAGDGEKPMARAITQMLKAPGDTQAMIRKTVTGFDWRSIAASMTETYRELLDRRNAIGNALPAASRHALPNLK